MMEFLLDLFSLSDICMLYVVLYFVINQHITLWGRKFQLGITNAQNFESNNPLVHVLYDVSTVINSITVITSRLFYNLQTTFP